jgi:hypothetical protein
MRKRFAALVFAGIVVSHASMASAQQNGTPCTLGATCSANYCSSQCDSGYCYPGPGGNSYCLDAAANCAQPASWGTMFGAPSYNWNGTGNVPCSSSSPSCETYACLEGQGLVLKGAADGYPCATSSQCASGYCYPGPGGLSYCIAETANCAEPFTEGTAYGTEYDYDSIAGCLCGDGSCPASNACERYSCVEGQGLVLEGAAWGAPCAAADDCASGSCGPGPEGQGYCMAADSNCGQPGTRGVEIGAPPYDYRGYTYKCNGTDGPPEYFVEFTNLGYADGFPCTSNSQCASGYCYPGPDQEYCVAAVANCAEPSLDGVTSSHGIPFGASYHYPIGEASSEVRPYTYQCVSGVGLVGSAQDDAPTLGCGLSMAYADSLYTNWTNWNNAAPGWEGQASAQVALANSVGQWQNYPAQLYSTQDETAPLLAMADYCEDVTLLDNFASMWSQTLGMLTYVSGSAEWIYPGPVATGINLSNEEVVLDTAQFSYAAAYLVRSITALPSYARTAKMNSFVTNMVPVLTQTIDRWLNSPSMPIDTACGLPNGVSDNEHAYNLSDYVNIKLNDCQATTYEESQDDAYQNHCLGLGTGTSDANFVVAPTFCNAVTEYELWAGAAATELLAASQVSIDDLSAWTSLATRVMQLFESRLKTVNCDAPYSSYHCFTFDEGANADHCPDDAPAWDFSHAKRLVYFTSTIYGHTGIFTTQPQYAAATVFANFANTMAYTATVYGQTQTAQGQPQFTNFVDGSNVTYYTVSSDPSAGDCPASQTCSTYCSSYGAFDLSTVPPYVYPETGYGLWGAYNASLQNINATYLTFLQGQTPSTDSLLPLDLASVYASFATH